MVLFTHNVKKIKGTACKNGDIDGRCQRSLGLDLSNNINVSCMNAFTVDKTKCTSLENIVGKSYIIACLNKQDKTLWKILIQ